MPKDNKPRGRMSAYAFFVQLCREEHKRKHPNQSVVFAEFSKKCAERWRAMNDKEKKRFYDMAEQDKKRHEAEMASYVPIGGQKRKKNKKDPNAPKRALSAFFFFCADERAGVKEKDPTLSVGEVAKILGARWSQIPQQNKDLYERRTMMDKERYEREMAVYRDGSKKLKTVQVMTHQTVEEDDEEEEEEEEDD